MSDIGRFENCMVPPDHARLRDIFLSHMSKLRTDYLTLLINCMLELCITTLMVKGHTNGSKSILTCTKCTWEIGALHVKNSVIAPEVVVERFRVKATQLYIHNCPSPSIQQVYPTFPTCTHYITSALIVRLNGIICYPCQFTCQQERGWLWHEAPKAPSISFSPPGGVAS
jgi:hypothetical protein